MRSNSSTATPRRDRHQSRGPAEDADAGLSEPGCSGGDETLWDHVSPRRASAWRHSAKIQASSDGNVENEALGGGRMTVSTLPLMKSGMEMSLGIDQILSGQSGKRPTSGWWRSSQPTRQMKLVSGITAEMLEKSVAASAKQDPEEYGKHLQQAWISGDTGPDGEDHAGTDIGRGGICQGDGGGPQPAYGGRGGTVSQRAREQAFVVVGAAHMVRPGRSGAHSGESAGTKWSRWRSAASKLSVNQESALSDEEESDSFDDAFRLLVDCGFYHAYRELHRWDGRFCRFQAGASARGDVL